ncbi:MAG: thioredoxin family protein [Armatimonadetes bacterium]|nr:thioredoxin family protein [Armatimonadota bacterium]
MVLPGGSGWAGGGAGSTQKWHPTYEAGLKEAAASGKPILVDFSAPWCGPCRKMEEETFRDPTVRGLLTRVVCVKLNVDQEPPLAAQFGVQSIPRLLLLPARGGRPILDLQGFRDAESFSEALREGLGIPPGAAVSTNAESPAAERVRSALQDGSFPTLRTAEPELAAAGLRELVAQLGVFREKELGPLAGLLKKGGDAVVPALLEGLNHRHLAVRTAAHRTLQEYLAAKSVRPGLPFDPWAAPAVRKRQAERWAAWWRRRK